MKYHDFINSVTERGRYDDKVRAEQVTKATLETLGERLAGGEATDLASQLPPKLASCVTTHAGATTSYDAAEFCRRIDERAGGVDDPMQAATAVFSVLADAVTPGEMSDLRSQLPDEYLELFPATATR